MFSEAGEQRTIVAIGTALAVLSCSIFFVNADPEKVSRRLEGAGTWAFHGFYSGSSYIINVGEKMISDPGEQIRRREAEIRKLEPFSSHPDLELGVLYHKLGGTALKARQYELAINSFTLAYANDSANASAIRSLGLIAMLNGRYNDAEEMLEYYNENLNRPIIRDFGALVLAQDLAHLRMLEADHADSSAIRRQREDVTAFYVGEYYK
jgi:tetratricopeptide (TPR) repeat protein